MARIYVMMLALLLIFGGCGLLGEKDTVVTANGTIINRSTGEPITGLSVVMKVASGGGGFFGGGGGYRVVASGRTDQRGQYQLKADLADINIAQVYLNEEPYDPAYFTFNYSIRAGEHSDETIELYETTTLHARVEISEALAEHDRYCLILELIGVCERNGQAAEVTDTRAKGNAYNRVRLVGTVGSKSVEIVDSVFCPVGEVTEYSLKY